MDDVEFANLVAGVSKGPVRVGLLDKDLASAVGTTNRNVLLSQYTIDKQRYSHPHLDFRHYKIISLALTGGYALVLASRPTHLVFGYLAPTYLNKPFKLVLKATSTGLYVETFHRISKKEFGRLQRQALKHGKLLRNPYND